MNKILTKIAVLILIPVFLLCGCSNAPAQENNSATDTDKDTAENSQPVYEKADGWYEISDFGELTVYLQSFENEWDCEANPKSVSILGSDIETDGFTAFKISSNETGSCDIKFTCSESENKMYTCDMTVYTDESGEISVTSADIPQKQPNAIYAPKNPLELSIDYHRSSALLEDTVGTEALSDANKIIDAFLNGETSIEITPEENSYSYLCNVSYALYIMCPPFLALTDFQVDNNDESTTISWNYFYDTKETSERMQNFEKGVYEITKNIDENDTQTAQAMTVYYQLVKDVNYNNDFFEDDTTTAEDDKKYNSPLNVISDHTGICSSISDTLAFIYNQLGIETITVSGESPEMFHQWTLSKIDDEYFYCDPTFDLGGNFRYFGINTEDRCNWAGNFDESTFTTCLKEPVSDSVKPESTRFAQLHSVCENGAYDFVLNHETQTAKFEAENFEFDCK